jgi:hypothetical protein
MIAAALAGLLAGGIHVLSGPDHLAALAPLSLRAGRRAWAAGLRWGLGHSTGLLLVAGLAFAFRQALDLDALGHWGERLVGASLLLLGLWGLAGLSRRRLHAHPHAHDGEAHVHYHVHAPDQDHAGPQAHLHGHAAFGIGVLHGLGGTAHLLGVLPGLALPTPAASASYLAAFAAGTVLAMTAFAAAVGAFAPRGTDPGLRAYRWMYGTASAACAATGLAWMIVA